VDHSAISQHFVANLFDSGAGGYSSPRPAPGEFNMLGPDWDYEEEPDPSRQPLP
jgi:hypothetical protein